MQVAEMVIENPPSPVEAMELLIDKLNKTKSNAEFLSAMQKMG